MSLDHLVYCSELQGQVRTYLTLLFRRKPKLKAWLFSADRVLSWTGDGPATEEPALLAVQANLLRALIRSIDRYSLSAQKLRDSRWAILVHRTRQGPRLRVYVSSANDRLNQRHTTTVCVRDRATGQSVTHEVLLPITTLWDLRGPKDPALYAWEHLQHHPHTPEQAWSAQFTLPDTLPAIVVPEVQKSMEEVLSWPPLKPAQAARLSKHRLPPQ